MEFISRYKWTGQNHLPSVASTKLFLLILKCTELSKLFSSLFWLNNPQAFNTGPAFNSFSQACEVNNWINHWQLSLNDIKPVIYLLSVTNTVKTCFHAKMLSLFLILSKGAYGFRVLEMEAGRRCVCDLSITSWCSDAGKWDLFLAWHPLGWGGVGTRGSKGKVCLENPPAMAQGFPSPCACARHASRLC